jgi:hypothetical protein
MWYHTKYHPFYKNRSYSNHSSISQEEERLKGMATVPNTRELTATDGSGPTGDCFNVDTLNGIVSVLNGKTLAFYADAYTTLTGQVKNGVYCPPVSSSAAAIASSGTITTANIGVARLAPTAAVSAVVMGTGTINGQLCTVINEAAQADSVQMAASSTSNVAAGINDIIWGGEARTYVWDNPQALWFDQTNPGGTTKLTPSTSAAAIASSGTITTANVGLARLAPTAAVTAVIMGTGTFPGQLCYVVNEATTQNFSVQMAASSTSNVADGVSCIIPGDQGRLMVWDSSESLWYEATALFDGKLYDVVSATAPALSTNGTVTTAGIGTSQVTPGSAVSSIVLAAGIMPGQICTVVNESTTAANSITFAASSTSNIANGTNTVISGLTCATFRWANSLWYHSV